MDEWLVTFPVPEEGPASHIRDLRVWIGGQNENCVPEIFFPIHPWFTNAESVALLGYGGVSPSRVPSLWTLPQSVTSLIIMTSVFAFRQVWDIMTRLPNLDDPTIVGSLIAVDKGMSPGIGTTLKGGFGGRLVLSKECVDEDDVNMLLEIPTRLHFTHMGINGTLECFLSTMRLAEVYGKTLVGLSYTADRHGKCHPS